MSEEIKGVDTIQGLAGEPPKNIYIEKAILETGTRYMQILNAKYMAFVPYCYKCKEPLNWIVPPDEDIVFRCPRCDRTWTLVKELKETK